ncbi:MAG: AsnC family protein [Candidatus Bathyarchaeota archaeon]|nr:MAG: AsnC family protein [Candidatus Bathyarchaeota archaeon]
MLKGLDFLDLKILEGLGIYGPRNMTAVARKLGLPEATLRRRLKQMLSQVFLQTNVYHTNIGLKKVIVFAKAFQGKEDLLYKCLDAYGYIIYISRCFGPYEGCVAIAAVPVECCSDFEQLLVHLQENGVAQNIKHYWSTCFQTVNIKINWFDEVSEKWRFLWKDWVHEVFAEGTELPFTLKDPAEYPQKADRTDIFILKELEADATISLKRIAMKLRKTVPLIKYHYDKHVVGQRLLENFQVVYYPFDKLASNGFYFVFRFENLVKMAKFARSLFDKPFALSLGKIFGEPSLFAYFYLPLSEFRNFVDSLGQLVRMGFLCGYDYMLQDMRMTQRYTIPYKNFENRSWVHDQEKYLQKISDLINAEKFKIEGRKDQMVPVLQEDWVTSHNVELDA